MTVDDATDVLWFYFGYAGFFTLTDDNSWSSRNVRRALAQGDGRAKPASCLDCLVSIQPSVSWRRNLH